MTYNPLATVVSSSTPSPTAGLSASTNRTPSTTRPSLVVVDVAFSTGTPGASGSTTVTANGVTLPSKSYQNPLAAGSFNINDGIAFYLPPNTAWSFTQTGTAATIKAMEFVL